MNERYSKLKTGLMSAMMGCPSHSFSVPSICSQYCQSPKSDTVAMTEGSCRTKVPLSKSKRCSSAGILVSTSPFAGAILAVGATVGTPALTTDELAFFEDLTSFAILAADSADVGP